MTTAVAPAIRERRLRLNLSSKAAAKLAAIDYTTWSRVENGHREPSPLSSAAITRALQWPPDALERIEAGEDPASLPTVEPEQPTGNGSDHSAEAVAAMIRGLPEDQQAVMLAALTAAERAEVPRSGKEQRCQAAARGHLTRSPGTLRR